MNLGDTAKSRCERCDGGPVRLVRRPVEDRSAGRHFLTFETIDVWKCEACGYEQGGSFQPDPRLLYEG